MQSKAKNERKPESYVCVSLDLPSHEDAKEALQELTDPATAAPRLTCVKVGNYLLWAEDGGAQTMAKLLDGHGLLETAILDVKFTDTPKTMTAAVRGALAHGFQRFTVSMEGGRPALEAALAACTAHGGGTPIAVSLLTSLGEEDLPGLGFAFDIPNEIVLQRVAYGKSAGITSFVCSPRDLQAIRHEGLAYGCTFYTPGIRPRGHEPSGQKRFATPAEAIHAGSDMLIVGGPIMNRVKGRRAAAYRRICAEVARALAGQRMMKDDGR